MSLIDLHYKQGLSVVMPAYNEAENISFVVDETLTILGESKTDYELILIDDGSTDDTLSKMRKVREKYPDKIRILCHEKNGGIGRAVRSGYRASRHELVTFIPADGQVSVQEPLKLLEHMKDCDLVITTYKQRGEIDPLYRVILSRGLRILIRLMTGISDRTDSIYVFRRSLLEQIPLLSTTFFVNLELPIRIILAGLPYVHKTINVRPRRSGSSKVMKWKVPFQIGLELAKFRLALCKEKRKPAKPFFETLETNEWVVKEI